MNALATMARSARRAATSTPLVLLLAAVGCSDSTGPLVTSWRATLSPSLSQPLSGRAAALTQAGRTQTTISIENGDAGEEYRWRLERGTCAAPQAAVGGAASYPPLATGTAGSASAEASLSELFSSGDVFHVRVLTGTGDTVACAAFEQVDA